MTTRRRKRLPDEPSGTLSRTSTCCRLALLVVVSLTILDGDQAPALYVLRGIQLARSGLD